MRPGGEAPEAAVAEAGVGLLLAELLEGGAHLLQALGHDVANPQVDEVVVEKGPEKELEREVVDALLALDVGLDLQVARLEGDHAGKGGVALLRRSLLERLAECGLADRAIGVDEVLVCLERISALERAHEAAESLEQVGHCHGSPLREGRCPRCCGALLVDVQLWWQPAPGDGCRAAAATCRPWRTPSSQSSWLTSSP